MCASKSTHLSTQDHIDKADRLAEAYAGGGISRRQFLTATAALPTAAILASCGNQGSNESGAAPMSVTLSTTESDADTLAYYRMVISDFKSEHPEASVEIQNYEDSTQVQFLQSAFTTESDVGVFACPSSFVTDWARAGHLLELDRAVEDIGYDDFKDGTRMVVDGHDYYMPFQANASAIWYRKDILDELGIGKPATYEEYLSAVSEADGLDGRIGIASPIGSAPEIALNFLTPYIYQSGWDYFDTNGELTFDEPEVLEGIQRYCDIMGHTSEGFYNATFDDIITTYLADRSAFATYPGRLGVSVFSQAPEIAENTGILRYPAGPFRTQELHYGNLNGYAIASNAANPELALEFLKTLTTGANAVEFALTVPGHLLPPLHSVSDSFREAVDNSNEPYLEAHADWVLELDEMGLNAMSPATAMGAVTEQSFDGRTSNPCPWASEVWKSPPLDGTMLQRILIEGAETEPTWTETCQQLRTISEEWLAKNPNWEPLV